MSSFFGGEEVGTKERFFERKKEQRIELFLVGVYRPVLETLTTPFQASPLKPMPIFRLRTKTNQNHTPFGRYIPI